MKYVTVPISIAYLPLAAKVGNLGINLVDVLESAFHLCVHE